MVVQNFGKDEVELWWYCYLDTIFLQNFIAKNKFLIRILFIKHKNMDITSYGNIFTKGKLDRTCQPQYGTFWHISWENNFLHQCILENEIDKY